MRKVTAQEKRMAVLGLLRATMEADRARRKVGRERMARLLESVTGEKIPRESSDGKSCVVGEQVS